MDRGVETGTVNVQHAGFCLCLGLALAEQSASGILRLLGASKQASASLLLLGLVCS